MIVYLARDIRPFVMYCVNGKPCSSLLIESTDSMISLKRVKAWVAVVKMMPLTIEIDKIPEKMTVVQLKAWLTKRGAPTKGNKSELVSK